MTTQKTDITIQQIQRSTIRVRIVGDSPLLAHNFDEKARKIMRDAMTKKARQAKEAKDPEDEFNRARYIDEQGRDSFPAGGIKKAIVKAARFADGIAQVEVAGAMHVQPGVEFIPIISEPPLIREDRAKVGMSYDLRYRPEYRKWSMEFDVVYNERAISAEQVVNMINLAGFGIGLGDWRPERNGQFGMFHVAAEGEV